MEEIVAFIRAQRERLAADAAWQEDYDPNDYEAFRGLSGEHNMLQELCWHFDLGPVDDV